LLGDPGVVEPSPVLWLLDTQAYTFRNAPPQRVRASLYHYDFTRARSPWAQRIPRAQMQPANCSALGPYAAGDAPPAGTAGTKASPGACSRWWRRTYVRNYLPPVDQRSLEQVVRQQGWPVGGGAPQRKSGRADPCRPTKKRGARRVPLAVCNAVNTVRRAATPLRSFAGFEVATGSGPAFVDGPLMVILGTGMAAVALGRLGKLVARLCGDRTMRSDSNTVRYIDSDTES
jgi:hypothetical protein